MDVREAIARRRSIRKFSTQRVSDEAVTELIEAARLAPSGCNVQPWTFIVVRDGAVIEDLRAHKAFRQNFVYAAPLIIVCCGDPKAYRGKLGGEGQVEEGSVPGDEKARAEMFSIVEGKEDLRTVRDVSIASAFLVLRATELGLGTSFIGLIDDRALQKVLGIPDDWVIPFAVIAGHPLESPKQRPRKQLKDITN
jgi:nitroreductase